jgi:hypothetical protein
MIINLQSLLQLVSQCASRYNLQTDLHFSHTSNSDPMQCWTSLIRQTLQHILSYFYLKAVSPNHFKRNGSEVTGASGRISLNALSTPLEVRVAPQMIEKYEPARISF